MRALSRLQSTAAARRKREQLLYYLLPLGLLLVYMLFVSCRKMNDGSNNQLNYYQIHYLYTYDHGFVSRGLVGEIVSWFMDTVSIRDINTISVFMSLPMLVGAALCIGSALSRTKTRADSLTANDDDRMVHRFVLLMVVVLCILPVTFRAYVGDLKLDKLLWGLTLFAVLLTEHSVGIWFTIPLCFLATVINPVFLFCSMLLISIILLQKLFDSSFSKKNLAICLVSYVGMIALGLFSALSEKKLGFADGYEMVDYYYARFADNLTAEARQALVETCLFDYFLPVGEVFKKTYEIYFMDWTNGMLLLWNTLFTAVPIYAVLIWFWRKVIKNTEAPLQKIVYLLCAVSPVVTVPVIILSWESSKYFANNILVQVILILYFLLQGRQEVVAALREAIDTAKRRRFFCVALIAELALCMQRQS